ncbi:MAG: nucleotidyltransferase [Bacilli bacterium]|nr:nucleotidyltransferase [Bacilli bacterium]
MKTVGIIVEYNPLHNGHLHHIMETRRISKCDCLIAVMSGNFTQRGEPAIVDKFTRTKMALLSHVDLVIELPFVFSVQSADIFAYGAVSLLTHLQVDEIYFGSESGSMEELTELSKVIASPEYDVLLQKHLKEGNSYPTSSDLAVKELSSSLIYHQPNNILGIQYISALKKCKSNIVLKTIKRSSTNYHDSLTSGTNIQSATAIRALMKSNQDYSNFVPSIVNELLQDRKPVDIEDFSQLLKYQIMSSSISDLENIFMMNEGLENRIKKCDDFDSIENFIKQIISKRYTNSKLKRTIIHLLCQTEKAKLTDLEVPYIRVLGFNDVGKAYLSLVKKTLTIPIISKMKEHIHDYLDLELKASKIYSIMSDTDTFKAEFLPIIYLRFD